MLMVEEASNVWYLYTLRVKGQPCSLKSIGGK